MEAEEETSMSFVEVSASALDPSPPNGTAEPVRSTDLKDMIRDAVDVKEGELRVPEWGVTFRLRGLYRHETKEMVEIGKSDPKEAEAYTWATGCIEPVFTLDEARELLATKAFYTTERVLMKVFELSGLADGFRP